jgi:hypothetical protein
VPCSASSRPAIAPLRKRTIAQLQASGAEESMLAEARLALKTVAETSALPCSAL